MLDFEIDEAGAGEDDRPEFVVIPDDVMRDAYNNAHTVPVRYTGSAEPPPPGSLSIYTIFKQPLDYPDKWIARRSDVIPGKTEVQQTAEVFVANSLEECRAMLPPGLHNIGREPTDDHKIYESWL
jgi:hypothetical protein